MRQRLSTTVAHAVSGLMLKVTTVGRPHFWQYSPAKFAMHECSSVQAMNNHPYRYTWPRLWLSFGSAMTVFEIYSTRPPTPFLRSLECPAPNATLSTASFRLGSGVAPFHEIDGVARTHHGLANVGDGASRADG